MKYLLSLFLFSLSLDAFANPPRRLRALERCDYVANTSLIIDIDSYLFAMQPRIRAIVSDSHRLIQISTENLRSRCNELDDNLATLRQDIRNVEWRIERAIEGLEKLSAQECKQEIESKKQAYDRASEEAQRSLSRHCSDTPAT
jgi:hypothetical protein